MNVLKYIQQSFQKAYKEITPEQRERLIQWRKEPTIVRCEKPSNPVRARALGYKAIQGIVVVRVKVRRGGRLRPRPEARRRPSKMGVNKYKPHLSLQAIAEQKAARKYRNMEVLNSYNVGKDGTYTYYEVILVDRNHPRIASDPNLSWICNVRGRAFRGLTSAGRKARGLMRQRVGKRIKRKSF
ncbi:MAG: 50S ribosomal protein L15e [archaeon]